MSVHVSISQESEGKDIHHNDGGGEIHGRNLITLRDIYKGLWKCRDFELSHLWQRSIFLATFLILVFTGYGKILEIHFAKGSKLCGVVFHLMSLGMAWAGMIVSTFWVCMAKGSKAWYERYEKAIGDFVECFGGENDRRAFASDYVAQIAGFSYENMISGLERKKREKKLERNQSLFNTGGANYSPSRINVSIGFLSFGVWLAVAMAHTGAIAYRFQPQMMTWRATMSVAFIGTIAIVTLCAWLASGNSPIASKGE